MSTTSPIIATPSLPRHPRVLSTGRPSVFGRGAAGLLGALLAVAAPTLAHAADTPATDTPKVSRFALVIGSNTTSSDDQSPLRFADDDAARIAEVLREAGTDVELLTTFDRDSQQMFSALVGTAKQPTPKAVREGYARLVKRMRKAKAQGEVELTIYYSGHGDVGPDGRGFLTLDGGRLTKHDLFSGMLGKSPADHNHILIDACRSEELVLSRGKGWQPDRLQGDYSRNVEQYLENDQLSSYPNTGVILASSVDQKTHEWDVYRGGIFTHQLVSGLRGAADLNGDGKVEYSEMGGFVSAANRGVSDPRGKLDVVVRAPAGNQRAPLLIHDDIGDKRVALFVGTDVNHYVLEDRRGVRLADLRRGDAHPTYVRLPEGDIFITRQTETHGGTTRKEAKISSTDTGAVLVRQLAFASPQRESRGALVDAFRSGLFRVGYGPSYYAGYTAQEDMLGIGEPDWEVRVWKRVDGEMVEVSRVTGTGEDVAVDPATGEPVPTAPKADADDCDCTDEALARELESMDHYEGDYDDDDDDDWSWSRAWGALSIGPVFTPFSPEGQIRLDPKRITSNSFAGIGDSGFQNAIRGGDLRWWFFEARDRTDYPDAEGYFRTGITQGSAAFLPEDDTAGFLADDATSLEYLTVPLFMGGNVYLFDRFPVRPFLGAGAGFDILRLDYARQGRGNLTDVSARIGFELHAGIDFRITNYVGVVAEVRQLWSARKKLPAVPDFSNEGLTLVTAIKFGFPLQSKHSHKARAKRKAKAAKRKAKAAGSSSSPASAPPAAPAPPTPPAGSTTPAPASSESVGPQNPTVAPADSLPGVSSETPAETTVPTATTPEDGAVKPDQARRT